ncbi:MAG: hypothetical protein ACRD9R_22100, partial [Pyrinomonadaceae bacterium]
VNLAANNQFVDGDKVAEYVRNAGVENEVVWAPAELFKLYLAPNRDGQIGVPYSILFGADGRAVARFDRFEDADKPAIEQAVQKAVTGNK